MLIDCGSTGGLFDHLRIRSTLEEVLGTRNTVDILLITHPDADHYNKIPAVFSSPDKLNFTVGEVVLAGDFSEYKIANMDDWLASFPSSRIRRLNSTQFNSYPPKTLSGFGSVKFEVLAADTPSSPNARSIVLKVTFGQFSMILPGDATKETDQGILSRFDEDLEHLDVDVIKAAHHGSWSTATHTNRWADATEPEVLLFSASGENYGHPKREPCTFVSGYSSPLNLIR